MRSVAGRHGDPAEPKLTPIRMQKRMGTLSRGGLRARHAPGRVFGALLAICSLAGLIAVPAAQATFHEISVREVFPGSAAQPQASYVELQMYEAGQHFVGGLGVTVYGSSGAVAGTFSFGSNLTGPSVSQQTILVGDSGVQAAFGVTPDLVDANFNLPASGAVCWAGSIDCVAWGGFSDMPPPVVGTPADSGGIPDGMAIRRTISKGSCTNLLDPADDTNDSAADFADATPAPVSYATKPSAESCIAPPQPPVAVIDTKPPSATNATSASFSFHSSPPGAEFECKLDAGSFADCDSGTATYAGPLSEASHTFQVRASNANGTGAAASYTWKVDLTAPAATITSHPVDPSPGATASFKYSSNETGSKFECQLAPLEASFTACNTQPKTYTKLADGEYEFEVRATDPAGNVQVSPTSFNWTVDNSLSDTTPPETTLLSKPPNPSSSSTASFTYSSNEPGSSFECKLDGAAFSSCPAAGITYTGLGNGSHAFQVRAIDPSANVDASPAGYTFDVVLPAPASPATPPVRPEAPPALPPQTVLSAKPPARTRDRTPSFRFRSSPGATFQCKLDGAAFKPCRSPFTTKTLSFARHTVKVRAVASGMADPTPASWAFKVVKGR
jgi:hypothetical protein